MSATSESIGSLVIDLRANVAQLRVDMDAVKETVQKSSREMSSQMRQDMNETRQVLALMRDDFGVGVPRELRKVIASSELARDAILGIKDALFGLAFLNLGIEAFKKIAEMFDDHGEAAKQIQEAAKQEKEFTDALKLGNTAHEERLRLIGLIGASAEQIYQSNRAHQAQLIKDQEGELRRLTAEITAKASILALDIASASSPGAGSEFAQSNPQDDIAALQKGFENFQESRKKALVDAQNVLRSLNDEALRMDKQHAEDNRQENKKTADEQQKQLDAAIVKLGEYRLKEEQTLDPLQRVTIEWEKIRAAQGALLQQYQTGTTILAAAGTLTAEWHAQQKVLTDEAAKLPGELSKGLAVLKEIEQTQGIPAVAGIAGSMSAGGSPQLHVDMHGAAVDRFASNFKDAAAQGKLLEKAMDDLLTPMDKFRIEQQEIEILKEKFKDYPEAVKALNLELLKANPEFQKLQEASAEFGHDLANELDNLAIKGEHFSDFLKNIAKDIEEIALKALLLKPLEDFFSGKGGSGGGITSLLGKLFSGLGFAGGGNPPVGQLSLVGENGPELFMPNSAGTIIPNGALGGDQYYISIDARGAAPGSEAAMMRGLQRVLESNRKQSVASAIDYQRRR